MYKVQEIGLKAQHGTLDMVQGSQMWKKICQIHVKNIIVWMIYDYTPEIIEKNLRLCLQISYREYANNYLYYLLNTRSFK